MSQLSTTKISTVKLLSIVIPVYNESENILLTIKSIKKNIKYRNEIIVVYDHNSDTTLPVLKKLKKTHKNLIVVKNNILQGPSGAIRTGFLKSKGNIVLVMMADLCDDLTQVDMLVKKLGNKQGVICPSRYAKGGRQELDSPFKVGFPKAAGFLLRTFTGIQTSDPTNSFKLYSKELINRMNLKSTISFSVTLEIVVKAHLLGAKIVEIPTVWKDRQHGKTNFKLGRSLIAYTPWFLLALLKNRLFEFPVTITSKFI